MSSWSARIYDTRTGVGQLQVFPSAGSWSRVLNASGQGSFTFQLGDRKLSRATWRDLTTPWARTVVLDRGGTIVYAGVITGRPFNRDKQELTLQTVDIRDIFQHRYPFGVTSYWADEAAHVPGKLVLTNLSYAAIAANVVAQGLIGPRGNYSLPIVLPSTTEAGGISKTYYNYNLVTVFDILDEIQKADSGPDIDFEPRSSTSGTLEWLMRVGVTGPTFEWNLTGKEPGLTGVTVGEDATKQADGVFSVGQGSEADMRVGGVGLPITTPALDMVQTHKTVDSEPELAGYSTAALQTLNLPTITWDGSFMAGEYPTVEKLQLGATIRIYLKGDPWLADGWQSYRLIGYSGDMSETIKLTVQPVGGA